MSYKILLFGNNIINRAKKDLIKSENAEIEICNYPNDRSQLQNLDKYDIVISHFRSFYYNKYKRQDEKIFRKSMHQATQRGTFFCFLHYQDNPTGRDKDKYIFGAKITKSKKVRTNYDKNIIIEGKATVNVFRPYLKKWGATHNYFTTSDQDNFEDIIYKSENKVLGFSARESNGLLIFLPFQQNEGSADDNGEGLKVLIDSLLNYKSKKEIDIPEWADKPFFKEESVLKNEIDEHESKLKKLREDLLTFSFAKSLLTAREYDLEKKIPAFFEEHLSISTLRDETFSEDFWIVDDEENPLVICEVKSRMKGFKKSNIYKLYNHREENGLEEYFPGLLIVNHHLQAGSWKDKDRKIDKKDYKTASGDNILIVRVEDLVRLWDGIRNDEISKNLVELFSNNSGWLEITKKFEIRIHN